MEGGSQEAWEYNILKSFKPPEAFLKTVTQQKIAKIAPPK